MQGHLNIDSRVASQDGSEDARIDVPEHIFDEMSFDTIENSRAVGRPRIPEKWSWVISMEHDDLNNIREFQISTALLLEDALPNVSSS